LTCPFLLLALLNVFSLKILLAATLAIPRQPFTPPPTNISHTKEWTTGSVYYATLLVAEAFGKTNQSQIVDMSNSTDIYHPAYAIYENGAPTRMVLFNYVNDPSGANTYTVTMNGFTSGQVFVRYLAASSVSEQYNITWAGQTMGYSFASDGRLHGEQATVTIDCANGACVVPVYAPSIALVFLSPNALTDSSAAANATTTFATTVMGTGSATVNPQVMETSNGQNGPAGQVGSTSQQRASQSGSRRSVVPSVGLVMGLVGMGVARTIVSVLGTICFLS